MPANVFTLHKLWFLLYIIIPLGCSPWWTMQGCPAQEQSPTQSIQALWPVVGGQESLWGTGILLLQDFCGEAMQAVTEQHHLQHNDQIPQRFLELFHVLAKCTSKFDCLIHEMLFIRKLKPGLNMQTDSIRAKSICLTIY